MTNKTAVLLVAGALVGGLAAAQDAAQIEKGKKIYENANPKCKLCHAIGGQGNPKGVLDGVAGKLSADDIKAWMRTPKDMAAKAKATRQPVMPAYPKEKLSDADLDALAAYLGSLK